MNTMNRLLTRRDKSGSHRRSKSSDPSSSSGKPRPLSSSGVLSLFAPDLDKKNEKDLSKKVQGIKQRLRLKEIGSLDEPQIEYALQTKYSDGDADKAFELLLLFQESVEGVVRPHNPEVYMKGAENRELVTCWLDSLLFAMFARLGSFEPILYTRFEDEPRRRLSTLIRLWVNMLRSGKLIQTDITRHLQEALAACGWEEAADLEQQDTSEAFGFITEKLELPLLTLEMDIFHEGKGDAADDHKFVNERLLEVAIPSDSGQGSPIRLEDCLEEHFNARVEVVRRLERRETLQRTNTRNSIRSGLSSIADEKDVAEHIEHWEAVPQSNSPPQSPEPSPSPTGLRRRAPSIIRRRIITEEIPGESSATDGMSPPGSKRKDSIRKEVLMPAWQFFRIIPWYTATVPANDAQVAAHFSSTRPVLGICLKRYAINEKGNAVRQNTAIDIPLQIALPHFIQDDKAEEGGPLFGNFNLVLQSMVCHRGNSVHSGHYISIIRGSGIERDIVPASETLDNPPEYSADKWIKFDDLASERVSYVDIEKAMMEEMPYLLFYQVQPLCEDPPSEVDFGSHPPSYQDSGIGMVIQQPSPLSGLANPFPASQQFSSYFDKTSTRPTTPSEETGKARISFSDDADRPRRSLNLPDSDRRGSLANTETSVSSIYTTSMPPTPGEETTPVHVQRGRLSRATSIWGKKSDKSKSRPNSHVDENRESRSSGGGLSGMGGDRISATFSRLNIMRSKEVLNRSDVIVGDVNLAMTSAPTSAPASTLTSAPANIIGEAASKRVMEKSEAGGLVATENGVSMDKVPNPNISTDRETSQIIDGQNIPIPPVPVTVVTNAGTTLMGRGKNLRSKSKSREKSDREKAPELGHQHHVSVSSSKAKDKAKDSAGQDRECVVM